MIIPAVLCGCFQRAVADYLITSIIQTYKRKCKKTWYKHFTAITSRKNVHGCNGDQSLLLLPTPWCHRVNCMLSLSYQLPWLLLLLQSLILGWWNEYLVLCLEWTRDFGTEGRRQVRSVLTVNGRVKVGHGFTLEQCYMYKGNHTLPLVMLQCLPGCLVSNLFTTTTIMHCHSCTAR